MSIKKVELFRDARFKSLVHVPNWDDILGEGENSMGTLAKAYSESVWTMRCVSIRANLLSVIPWCIRPKSDDDNEPIEDHELVKLISDMDEETNWEQSLRSIESDMDIFGTAYIQKVRAGSMVISLRRLNPITMEVVKSASGIGGFVQRIDNTKVTFPREDVIYFHEYHPTDDLGGLSMTQIALPSIQALTNTEKYLSAFFENSALPSIIMTTEQDLTDQDFGMLQRWWAKTFKGVKKSHQVGFMSRGIKPETISYPLTDLALEQVRETCRRDICGVFGVPPSIAGAWESANYATALEERRSIYTETLIPRARYYESQINTYLVDEVDPSVEFAFLFDELEVMAPDKKADAERLAILVNAKIIKPETAALEMGYSEDDVPEEAENPVPEQLEEFTGLPQEEIDKRKPEAQVAQPAEDDAPAVDESQFKAEIGAWRRKSLRLFKAEAKANCEFVYEVIPDTLAEAIKMQLEAAESVEDIRAVFDGAKLYDSGHRKRVKAEIMDEARADIMNRIEVKAPDVVVNVPAPVVNVSVPEIKVPAVKFEPVINIPDIKVPEPKVINREDNRDSGS